MRPTRRAALAALGGAATTGLAGCIGGGGGGGGGEGGTGNGSDAGAADSCDPEQTSTVRQQSPPSLGPDDAPVTLMVFEDYACPHCVQFSLDVFPKIRSNYVDSGEIRYQHRDFPIPVLGKDANRWSWRAASAGRGVKEAGGDGAFFEFTHELFRGYQERANDNNYSYTYDNVAAAADAVGAPKCEIVGDAKFETFEPVLQTERTRGEELGLAGTPAIFVDGGSGDPTYLNPDGKNNDYETVKKAIDSRL